MMVRSSHIIRDTGGTSVVELGLILPIFAMMLAGVVDLSRAYSTKLQIQQAAQRAVERIQRSGYQVDDEATIEAEAAAGAGVSTSNVTLEAWLECNGAHTSFTGSCGAGQTMARYVTVEVRKNFTAFFTPSFLPGGVDTYTLVTEAGIRVQ